VIQRPVSDRRGFSAHKLARQANRFGVQSFGLSWNSSLGVLSTHDLTLTEIAELEGLAVPRTYGIAVRRSPMDFDYLLKAGMTTETNALAIAEMMVPIGELPRESP